MRYKGQAMVEYVLLLSIVFMGFVVGLESWEGLFKNIFETLGEFISKVGP